MAAGWGWAPQCLPMGSGLGHHRTSAQILCVLGGLSQESGDHGVRVGFAPHFLRSSSQYHPLVINNQEGGEQSRDDSNEKRVPEGPQPHAVLRARETTKEKHKPRKIDLGASPLESQELKKQAGLDKASE